MDWVSYLLSSQNKFGMAHHQFIHRVMIFLLQQSFSYRENIVLLSHTAKITDLCGIEELFMRDQPQLDCHSSLIFM